MPPVSLDLTINVATLGLTAGLVWKASALVTEFRLTRLHVEKIDAQLEAHEERDEKRFSELANAIRELQLDQARHGARR